MSNIKSTRAKRPTAGDLLTEVLEEDRPAIGPIGEDGLTDKQRGFVEAFCRGATAGNSTKSAEIAGYSQKSAPSIGSTLTKHPAVIVAIEAELRLEIGANLTAESIAFLGTVLRDTSAPQKLRTVVALELVKGSGVMDRVKIEKAKQTGLTSDKNLLDMSRDELETLVRQGAAVLKAAAALPAAGPVLEGRLLGDGAQDRAQPEETETE